MKAEQPEKTHLEESAQSETQLLSQGHLLALQYFVYMLPMKQTKEIKRDLTIKIDDQSVGSIRLFPMINYEMSAVSQH